MRYKRLTNDVERSYIGFEGWGVGVTIIETSKSATVGADLIVNDTRVSIIENKKFPSVPEAKLWIINQLREMVAELREWVNE